jgi:hypothetical protein
MRGWKAEVGKKESKVTNSGWEFRKDSIGLLEKREKRAGYMKRKSVISQKGAGW